MNKQDARMIVTQLTNLIKCNVDVFDTDGYFIYGNSENEDCFLTSDIINSLLKDNIHLIVIYLNGMFLMLKQWKACFVVKMNLIRIFLIGMFLMLRI